MKNRVYILTLVFAALFFCGCEKLDIPDEKKTEMEQKGKDEKEEKEEEGKDEKEDGDNGHDGNDGSDGNDDGNNGSDDGSDDGKDDGNDDGGDGKDDGNDGNNGSDDGKDDGNDDGSDDGNDDGEGNHPDGDGYYHGFYTLFDYISYFGNFEHPVPYEDMLSGGCLYVRLVENEYDLQEIDDMWVEGFVVGYVKSRSMGTTVFDAGSVATNLVIAELASENDYKKCVPVQLSNSSKSNQETRAALNLKDHPNVLGKKVKIRGDLAKYMGVVGVKNAKEYVFVEVKKK